MEPLHTLSSVLSDLRVVFFSRAQSEIDASSFFQAVRAYLMSAGTFPAFLFPPLTKTTIPSFLSSAHVGRSAQNHREIFLEWAVLATVRVKQGTIDHETLKSLSYPVRVFR